MSAYTPLRIELEFARQPSMSRLIVRHPVGSSTYVRNDLLTEGQRRHPFWGRLARLVVRWEKRNRRPTREQRAWARWQFENDDRIAAEARQR